MLQRTIARIKEYVLQVYMDYLKISPQFKRFYLNPDLNLTAENADGGSK
jgi:hypothetical protein